MKMHTLLLVLFVSAQLVSRANNNVTDSIPADPKDVGSADAIISALYGVISGPAGEKRNWDRMRTLFTPDARMNATGRRNDGTYGRRTMSIEDYIASSGPFLEKDGFFEKEISRKYDTYGGIMQIFSTYESRKKADDPNPFVRGINSIQMWNDGKRWWIISILWQSENKSETIPDRYLQQ